MTNTQNNPIKDEEIREALQKIEKTHPEEADKFSDLHVVSQDEYDELEELEKDEIITKLKIVDDFMRTWLSHEGKNQLSRKILLVVFCCFLGGQLVSLNVLIYLKAFGRIALSDDFLKWFITEVFLQILATVFFMIKYLYNNGYDKIMRAILALITTEKGKKTEKTP